MIAFLVCTTYLQYRMKVPEILKMEGSNFDSNDQVVRGHTEI